MKVMTWVPEDKINDQDQHLSEEQVDLIHKRLDRRGNILIWLIIILFLSCIPIFVYAYYFCKDTFLYNDHFYSLNHTLELIACIAGLSSIFLFGFISVSYPLLFNSSADVRAYLRENPLQVLINTRGLKYGFFRMELLKAQLGPIKVDDLSKFCSTYGVYEMREKVREMVKNVDQLSAYKGKIVNLQINLKNHLMVIQGDSDIIKSIKQSVKNKLNQLDEVYAQVVDEEKRWLKQIGDLESKSEVFRQVYLLTKLEVDFQATDDLICEAKAYLEILSESSQSLSQSVKNFELNHKELLAFSVTQPLP